MRARADAHAPYRELIAIRLDRPLTRSELRTLNAHLKQCRGCQQAETDYRAQRAMLRTLPTPIPPRDMWARTSAALDHEVARGVRASWSRRVRRAQRRAQPTPGMATVLAALGVVTALAVFQLSPSIVPSTGAPVRPTPFAVNPEPLAFVGLSGGDVAIYRTVVRQVCPQSEPIDCVATERIERTPLGTSLPEDIHAGNIALSPNGRQLSLVGRNVDADVIAVVLMPDDSGGALPPNPTDSVGSGEPTEMPAATPALSDAPATSTPPATPELESPASTEPTATAAAESAPPTDTPSTDPSATAGPKVTRAPAPTAAEPTPDATASPKPAPPTAEPTTAATLPPAGGVAELEVVNILEGVRSAGAPPAWSRNGEMLAFSAMPVDGSYGPDVYLWSPGDRKARAITSDHASYFASWSGNRLVVSRASVGQGGGGVPRSVVIDPRSGEERPVGGPGLWLPAVSLDRNHAIVWSGDLAVRDGRPMPRSGALYVMDWTSVDPFRPTAPEDTDDDVESIEPSASEMPEATPTPTPEDAEDPTVENAPLVPLEADRDPRSAPVVDWLVRWSPNSRVLGVWIADSDGSNWGRLSVLAVDTQARRVVRNEPLLETTLARRGFSLSSDRVAWVAPTDENLDGELRIRAWTSDGVGGLRVIAPDEEVLPAL